MSLYNPPSGETRKLTNDDVASLVPLCWSWSCRRTQDEDRQSDLFSEALSACNLAASGWNRLGRTGNWTGYARTATTRAWASAARRDFPPLTEWQARCAFDVRDALDTHFALTGRLLERHELPRPLRGRPYDHWREAARRYPRTFNPLGWPLP